jgi:hypothetical protein
MVFTERGENLEELTLDQLRVVSCFEPVGLEEQLAADDLITSW